MPAYGQAAFLPRAVSSLLAQELAHWELLVVDDGSPDDVSAALAAFMSDPRVSLHRLVENRGLGAALNVGLAAASAPLIAYLPCDDVFYPDHLTTLMGLLDDGHGEEASPTPRPGAGASPTLGPLILAHTACEPRDEQLQLVQLMHHRTPDRWVERDELESDDLEVLFLHRLRRRGRVIGTDKATCGWTQHPGQRHRAIREASDGGLNVFRSRYRVGVPLRLRSSEGWSVDEVSRYARFRSAPAAGSATAKLRAGGQSNPTQETGHQADSAPTRSSATLRILLAGELAFNPERVVALQERGHELMGYWIDNPLGFNTVGPLPFGEIADLHSIEDIRRARPDVIYALLNWRSVPLAHALLEARTGVPLVFHYKEAPQRSIARGEWPLLADVVTRADAVVLSSPEERDWFDAALPGRLDPERTLVLDGDLPKREWLEGDRSPRLSARDGRVHTVLLGRPYGFSEGMRRGLADHGVELHVHSGARAVEPADWVSVLSRYDAGWLHPVRAGNGGDIRRTTWDDLNLPARIPTLVAAGLPLILPRNEATEIHAAQSLAQSLGVAVLYEDLEDLAGQLGDDDAMTALRQAAWARREELTFDAHADELLTLFRAVRDDL